MDHPPAVQHLRLCATAFSSGVDAKFADIRHPLRRIVEHQDTDTRSRLKIPVWGDGDPLHALLTLLFGRYPAPDANIVDYKGGVQNAFGPGVIPITPADDIPFSLLEIVSLLGLTSYDLTRKRDHRHWLGLRVVLGSVSDFDSLSMFWNLRAAGAQLIFYDQVHGERLKSFANAYLAKLRSDSLDEPARVHIWTRPFNPDTTSASLYLPSFEAAARSLKIARTFAPVRSDLEIETAIIDLGREPGKRPCRPAGRVHARASRADHIGSRPKQGTGGLSDI